MHHPSPASMGDIFSDISLPYKHIPASVLSMSLAPRPAILTDLFDNTLSHNSTTLDEGIEI